MGETIRREDAPPKNPMPFGFKQAKKDNKTKLNGRFMSSGTIEANDGVNWASNFKEKIREKTEKEKSELKKIAEYKVANTLLL